MLPRRQQRQSNQLGAASALPPLQADKKWTRRSNKSVFLIVALPLAVLSTATTATGTTTLSCGAFGYAATTTGTTSIPIMPHSRHCYKFSSSDNTRNVVRYPNDGTFLHRSRSLQGQSRPCQQRNQCFFPLQATKDVQSSDSSNGSEPADNDNNSKRNSVGGEQRIRKDGKAIKYVQQMFLELQNDVPLEQEVLSSEQLELGFVKLRETWKRYNATEFIITATTTETIDSQQQQQTEKDESMDDNDDNQTPLIFASAQEHMIRAYLRQNKEKSHAIRKAKTLIRGPEFVGIIPTSASLELLWNVHIQAYKNPPPPATATTTATITARVRQEETHIRAACTLLLFWKYQYRQSLPVRRREDSLKPPRDHFLTLLSLLKNNQSNIVGASKMMYDLYKAMCDLEEGDPEDKTDDKERTLRSFSPTPDVMEWLLESLVVYAPPQKQSSNGSGTSSSNISNSGKLYEYGQMWHVIQHAVFLFRKSGNKAYRPTRDNFHAVLLAAANRGRARDATWLFRAMERCWEDTDSEGTLSSPSLEQGPTMESIRLLVTATVRSQELGSVIYAEKLLHHLEQQSDHPNLRPGTEVYNLVLEAWASNKMSNYTASKGKKSKSLTLGGRAEALLSRMDKLCIDQGEERCKPNEDSYRSTLMVYLNEIPSTLESVSNADRIYRQMNEKFHKDKNVADGRLVRPRQPYLDKIIAGYSRLYRNVEAAQRGDRLYRYVLTMYSKGGVAIEPPDVFAYGHVLKCWNKARASQTSTKKSLEIFRLMEQLHAENKTQVVADSYCLRQLVDTLAYSDQEGYGKLSVELLERLIKLQGDSPDPVILGHAFWCATRCFSNEKDPTGANVVLERMISLFQENKRAVRMTGAPFKTVVNCCAMHGQEGAGEQAERIVAKLENMYFRGNNREVRPSVDMYNDLIRAWIRDPQPGSGEKAQDVLRRMLEMNEKGVPGMAPNGFTYMALAVAHVSCPDKGSIQRAEDILLEMTEWYLAGNKDMRVNGFTWNSVIEAWSRHSDGDEALKRTRAIVDKLRQKDTNGKPLGELTSWTYESLLRSLAKTPNEDCLSEMESLLEKINPFYYSKQRTLRHLRPSINHVNLLLKAYSQNLDNTFVTEKTIDVFKKTQKQFELGNRTMKPNSETFSTVIDILTRSNRSTPTQGYCAFADSMLKRMEESGGPGKVHNKPTEEDYRKVIECYQKNFNSPSVNQIVQRMERTHKTVSNSVEPMEWNQIGFKRETEN